MVVPPFGFSVGDFIAGAQLLVEVIGAFKEVGGAKSKYAAEVSFLNTLKSTLEHLEKYVSNTSPSDVSQDIANLLQEIRGPWDEFKRFLDKYESALGNSSTKSRLRKAPRKIRYTVKDISGEVEKLRLQAERPLQAVNSLLSLHVITILEKLPDQLLQPSQCAQLVEAIRLADIPTELDKQISSLQRTADEHEIKQDQQLQVITTLRDQLANLDEKIMILQSTLGGIQDEPLQDSLNENDQNEQLALSKEVYKGIGNLSEMLERKSDQLESTMKKQQQLILALKSFLEDKVSQSISEPKSLDNNTGDREDSIAVWPTATLSAAYFAALLFSSVVSSVAATSVINRGLRSGRAPYLNRSRDLTFLPIDYSLPGLERLGHQRQRDRSLPTNRACSMDLSANILEAAVTTDSKAGDASHTKVSRWLFEWSNEPKTTTQRSEQPRKRWDERAEVIDFGWSSKLSKLSDSENGDFPLPDDGDGDRFIEGPGPMIPMPTDEGFDLGIPGFSGGGDGESGNGESGSDDEGESDGNSSGGGGSGGGSDSS